MSAAAAALKEYPLGTHRRTVCDLYTFLIVRPYADDFKRLSELRKKKMERIYLPREHVLPLFQLAVRYALPNVLAYVLDKYMLPDGTDCATSVEAMHSCMNDRILGGARPSSSDVLEVLKLLNEAVRTGHVSCGGGGGGGGKNKRPHDVLRVHLRHHVSTRPVKDFWSKVDDRLQRQKEAARAFVKDAGLRALMSGDILPLDVITYEIGSRV